jgi:hypothetical protein
VERLAAGVSIVWIDRVRSARCRVMNVPISNAAEAIIRSSTVTGSEGGDFDLKKR